eukprot:scaffold209159_cov17-Tisochrysis_lutea.AAC.1
MVDFLKLALEAAGDLDVGAVGGQQVPGEGKGKDRFHSSDYERAQLKQAERQLVRSIRMKWSVPLGGNGRRGACLIVETSITAALSFCNAAGRARACLFVHEHRVSLAVNGSSRKLLANSGPFTVAKGLSHLNPRVGWWPPSSAAAKLWKCKSEPVCTHPAAPSCMEGKAGGAPRGVVLLMAIILSHVTHSSSLLSPGRFRAHVCAQACAL